MIAPRLPEPMKRIATLTTTMAAETAPRARGGSRAASTSSDANHTSWLTTWPAAAHDAARPTMRADTSGATARSSGADSRGRGGASAGMAVEDLAGEPADERRTAAQGGGERGPHPAPAAPLRAAEVLVAQLALVGAPRELERAQALVPE